MDSKQVSLFSKTFKPEETPRLVICLPYLPKHICVWLVLLTTSMQPLIAVISSSQQLFQIFFLVSMRIDISWIAFYSVVSLSLSF